jgi:hypothetical protein
MAIYKGDPMVLFKNLYANVRLIHISVSSLIASLLVLVPIQSSNAHGLIEDANIAVNQGTVDASLFVATKTASTAVAHTAAALATGHADARSTSLFYKDSTSGTAQTATVKTGGLLSLYANISTTTAISATDGIVYGGTSAGGITKTTSTGSTGTAFTVTLANAGTATAIGLIYQAPSSATTVTITLSSGGTTAANTPTATNPLAGGSDVVLTVTVLGSTNLSTTHSVAGSSDNLAVVSGPVNASLLVATATNTGGSAVAPTAAAAIEGTSITSSARSSGLLSKDSTMATAQTATILASGKLSLYANISTTVAFTASGGTFASTNQGSSAATVTYSDPSKTSLVVLTAAQNALGATAVGTLWTAPSTAGTYTVSLYKHGGTSTTVPTLASPSLGTLAGAITVTVVASSAGGAYSAANSACLTHTTATDSVYDGISGGTLTADSTSSRTNGQQWYIGFKLNDAYGADLPNGNLVASATNGGIISIDEDGDEAAQAAGTGSTVVEYGNGDKGQIRVDQPTAGAPLTTTVTITYNGTTVCTKTVTISGAPASITISDVATVDLGGAVTNTNWLSDVYNSGAASGRDGHFYVLLKDSAGNIVLPAASSEFSMDAATTTTTVTALAVNSSVATTTSSSSAFSKSVGTFTCGPAAGSSAVKLKHTSASTGVTITSPAFTARCADDPYTYTASWDKASYVQGEIATLTVKFLDSKGNAANSLDTPGAVTMITPMLTAVTTTGSATMLPKADGTKTYTFTVGTTTGMTAGTYTSVIDFTSLTAVAAEKQTPTYKLGTTSTDVTFTEVLKSVVALIASINKQIQALQKLILKR